MKAYRITPVQTLVGCVAEARLTSRPRRHNSTNARLLVSVVVVRLNPIVPFSTRLVEMETYIINTLAVWVLFLLWVAGFVIPLACAAEVSRRGYSWWVTVLAGIFAYFCWPLILFVWLVARLRRATAKAIINSKV